MHNSNCLHLLTFNSLPTIHTTHVRADSVSLCMLCNLTECMGRRLLKHKSSILAKLINACPKETFYLCLTMQSCPKLYLECSVTNAVHSMQCTLVAQCNM